MSGVSPSHCDNQKHLMQNPRDQEEGNLGQPTPLRPQIHVQMAVGILVISLAAMAHSGAPYVCFPFFQKRVV